MTFNNNFQQPQQGFQQQGFPQQGGYQQQPQGGPPQGGADQGTITKIYENQRQDGSISYAVILDNDNTRRYTTKYRPEGEGLVVQIQYKEQNGKRFIRKLDKVGGAPQQPQGGFNNAPQQQGFQQQAPTQNPPAAQGGYPQQAPAGQARQGMQVGNALNNAAAILGPGSSLAQLEATAFAILDIADRLTVWDTSHVQQQPPAQGGFPQQGFQG